jgi:two-component system, OmpR family, phosphate regulon sensor histidine kinase PhoR
VNADAVRGRALLEETREPVVVLNDADCVVAASRRARESIDGLEEGRELPEGLRQREGVLEIPYDVAGRPERLVFLGGPDATAYEELRSGFTAAVSHELRTPLARLLALLETAGLPGEDVGPYLEQARAEVVQITELIDDVLFLSELETGRAIVGLGATPVRPVLEDVAAAMGESAARAAVAVRVAGDRDVELPLRPRMLRVVAENLVENAIRYAGPGTTLSLSAERADGAVVLRASDDGVGVLDRDLPRLFERFYRADRSRASRGTGLGLAIVKHVVTAAGGHVEARSGRGEGLHITCTFPSA